MPARAVVTNRAPAGPTTWLTHPTHGTKIAEIYGQAFTSPPPARSAPVVQGFPIPEALISIEAIAALQ